MARAPKVSAIHISLEDDKGDYYQPHPQQIKFHKSKAKYRLYGGAKGGGKSLALLWEAISWCLKVPGCNVLLLRRTFPELEKGLIRHFEQYVPAALYGGLRNYNKSSHTVSFGNGSRLYFGCAQHEHDIMSYQGHEYIFIGLDEATEFTYKMFEFLTIQNRCPVKKDVWNRPIVPCMALATNPGEIGHMWVRGLFVGLPDPNDPKKLVKSLDVAMKVTDNQITRYDPNDYDFVPAKVFDNPAYKDDKDYLDKLKSMNESDKARYLFGSWDIFVGQYFGKFDRNLTLINHHEAMRLVRTQPWNPCWIGIDWGYDHWCAIFWFAQVEVSDFTGEKREITLVYREMVVRMIDERPLAQMIGDASRYTDTDGKVKIENIQNIYISPDAKAKRGSAHTIQEEMNEVFYLSRLPNSEDADNDRIGGWRLMDSMLSRRPYPDLLISDECEQLLDAIPQLIRDERNSEDVKKTLLKSDDIGDAARYGLKSYLAAEATPFQVERQRTLAEAKTNQERFWLDMAMQQKKKASIGIHLGKKRDFRGMRPF